VQPDGQAGRGRDDQLGVAMPARVQDLPRRAVRVDRQTRQRPGPVKPGEFTLVLSLEEGVIGRSGAHETRADRRHRKPLARQLGADARRQPGERKLAGAVRQQVRHRDPAPD
jgi:hypothetical protein